VEGKRYLTKRQEAERIGRSTRTLERLCADEGYPFIQLDGRPLFDPELSDQFIAARIRNPPTLQPKAA